MSITRLGLSVPMNSEEYEEFENKIGDLPFIKKLNNEYLIESDDDIEVKFHYSNLAGQLLISYGGQVNKRFKFIYSLPTSLLYKERLALLGLKVVELKEGRGIVFYHPAQLDWYNREIADTGQDVDTARFPIVYIPQTLHTLTSKDIIDIYTAMKS